MWGPLSELAYTLTRVTPGRCPGLEFANAFGVRLSFQVSSAIVCAMKDENATFDLQPHLIGDLIDVRPLTPADWEGLFTVASDPLIWEQHPAWDRYREDVFREFFREALETGSAFVVIDRKTGEIIGSSRYHQFDGSESSVEIGWTFLARAYWGGNYNGELKRLMLDHAFRFVERVLFVIGVTNYRSQKAVEKIGAVRVGRRDRVVPRGGVECCVYELRRLG